MKKYNDFHTTDFIKDDEFFRWIKYGKSDVSLDKKWSDYLLNHPQQRETIEQAARLLRSVIEEQQNNLSEQKQKELWNKIEGTINELQPSKKSENHFLITYSIAATIVLLIIAGLFILNKPASTIFKANSKIAIIGSSLVEYTNLETTPHRVVLADGSVVTLQPNSTVRCPEKFESTNREVYLSGEAFFSVTKDPNRPFIVHANELITRVLGTSFNIRAYDRERKVSVVVKTGKVSVYEERAQSDNKITLPADGTFLLPNQQVVFSRDEKRMIKSLVAEPTVLMAEIAKEEFQFTDTPIREVFKKLESAYGIMIIYDEEVMHNCLLNASLTDLNFHDKLRVICKGINAKYEILDAHIIISGTGCK